MRSYDLTSSTSFRLTAVPPYNFLLSVHKPAGWTFLTPYEVFEDDVLWAAMRMPSGEMFGLKLESEGTVEKPRVLCELCSNRKLSGTETKRLRNIVSWMLRTEEDVKPFYMLARHDSLVKALVEDLYGMHMTERPDIFPQLILAVTLQMAPIKRSDQMMDLLVKEFGVKVRFDGQEVLYWPSPERIAQATEGALREKCKLGYRAPVLKGIAQTVSDVFPTLQELENMSSDEAKAKLMELKGIGEYSADIVSPHFGFPLDVWSAKIFSILLTGKKHDSNPRSMIPRLKQMAEKRWREWRGYVFVYVLNDIPNLSRRYELNLQEL